MKEQKGKTEKEGAINRDGEREGKERERERGKERCENMRDDEEQ